MPELCPALSLSTVITRLAAGRDEEAWALLVACQGQRILGLSQRVLGNAALADDATQDALLAIHAHASQCRLAGNDPEAAARGWIARIAITTACKLRRAEQRRQRHERRAGAIPLVTPASVADDAQGEEVRRAIDALPAGRREVLLLHVVAGLDHQEIGTSLGISPGAVRVRLHRTLVQLRRRLGVSSLLMALPHLMPEAAIRAGGANRLQALVATVSELKPRAMPRRWLRLSIAVVITATVMILYAGARPGTGAHRTPWVTGGMLRAPGVGSVGTVASSHDPGMRGDRGQPDASPRVTPAAARRSADAPPGLPVAAGAGRPVPATSIVETDMHCHVFFKGGSTYDGCFGMWSFCAHTPVRIDIDHAVPRYEVSCWDMDALQALNLLCALSHTTWHYEQGPAPSPTRRLVVITDAIPITSLVYPQ